MGISYYCKPLALAFGSATGAHLNLITCDANTTF
jgi:hypothetical protein